ncbi:MAG: hypothetical protein IJG38_14405 [Thermoguttaceae bacterium]|nr:hypothetical protein [Thermoguttaceae bacterium]MBQ6616585.1 hypothetical protein [Thermoguttaceae bacterium]
MTNSSQNFGSFRDPAGRVFELDNKIYRSVTNVGQKDYQFFLDSGLAESLQKSNWIIPFRQVERPEAEFAQENVYAWLLVDKVPFISYPYEWSFHQLKDSAVLTLKIQLAALKKGMSLKDASAYNVQMYKGRPIFIDLLSFERYEEGKPWVAYRQFVMHFLAPLLLMSKRDVRFSAMFRNWIDGFPLDFTSKNLPWATHWSPSCLVHIHWHAKLLRKYESTRGEVPDKTVGTMSKEKLTKFLEGLLDYVQSIKAPHPTTEWGDYYNDLNYSDAAFKFKQEIVGQICQRLNPKTVCDLGANCGEFSRVLPKTVSTIISPDIDPVAVDKNYVQVRTQKETNIYPILQDLTNPSPGIGWQNEERQPFTQRAQCDMLLSLALIHHLCIGNNLPFDYVAQFYRKLSPVAVVEFVPKDDSQTQRLLSSREDIFPNYNLEQCISAFLKYYNKVEQIPVKDMLRTILVFE